MSLESQLIECAPVGPCELFAVLDVAGRTIIAAVAHSPIEGSSDTEGFYESLGGHLRTLRSKCPHAFVWVVADLNARVGSMPSRQIGNKGAQMENVTGSLMRAFLAQHELVVVNMAFERGCGWTWTGSRSNNHRIDYVCCLEKHISFISDCQVNYEIDLVDSARDDHNLVVATVELDAKVWTREARTANRISSRLCKDKLRDPALRRAFEH